MSASLPLILTLKSVNPSEKRKSSDSSVTASFSAVISSPVLILVARQAYAGLFQVNSPASRDSSLIMSLVSPHSLSGDLTSSSLRARIPGRSPSSSEALVPSSMRLYPSSAAAFAMLPKMALLQ